MQFHQVLASLFALIATTLAAEGTVYVYSDMAGYGIINPDDGSEQVFLATEDVELAGIEWLREGDRVQYDVNSDNGIRPQAFNIVQLPPSA